MPIFISSSHAPFSISKRPTVCKVALALSGAGITALALAACQQSASPTAPQGGVRWVVPVSTAALQTIVDDRETGSGVNRFRYSGRWAYVAERRDGRVLGTSTRSFHVGDTALFTFRGTQARLYGVLGKKGGIATVTVDGDSRVSRLDFYAPSVRPASLVLQSPVLRDGIHTLKLTVTNERERGGGNFVNIDYATYTAAPMRMPAP